MLEPFYLLIFEFIFDTLTIMYTYIISDIGRMA